MDGGDSKDYRGNFIIVVFIVHETMPYVGVVVAGCSLARQGTIVKLNMYCSGIQIGVMWEVGLNAQEGDIVEKTVASTVELL